MYEFAIALSCIALSQRGCGSISASLAVNWTFCWSYVIVKFSGFNNKEDVRLTLLTETREVCRQLSVSVVAFTGTAHHLVVSAGEDAVSTSGVASCERSGVYGVGV